MKGKHFHVSARVVAGVGTFLSVKGWDSAPETGTEAPGMLIPVHSAWERASLVAGLIAWLKPPTYLQEEKL